MSFIYVAFRTVLYYCDKSTRFIVHSKIKSAIRVSAWILLHVAVCRNIDK